MNAVISFDLNTGRSRKVRGGRKRAHSLEGIGSTPTLVGNEEDLQSVRVSGPRLSAH
jgi:hypothetical protein